jgi:hypothetical protein
MPEPVAELSIISPKSVVAEATREGTAVRDDRAHPPLEQDRASDDAGPKSEGDRQLQPGAKSQSAETTDSSKITTREKEKQGEGLASIVGVVATVIFIVLVNDESRTFVFRNWLWFGLGAGLVAFAILMVVLIPAGRLWLKNSLPTTRAGLFIFIILPATLTIVGSVILLPQAYQVMALRAGFLVAVCLLPALMWYLFLVTRKGKLAQRVPY